MQMGKVVATPQVVRPQSAQVIFTVAPFTQLEMSFPAQALAVVVAHSVPTAGWQSSCEDASFAPHLRPAAAQSERTCSIFPPMEAHRTSASPSQDRPAVVQVGLSLGMQ